MKILVDMNLSPRWASELQSRGFEAVHWSKIGDARASDAEILEWCARKGHLLLTHDLDFGAILAASRGSGPSVVQLRGADVTPESMLPRVAGALRQLAAELGRGALVTIASDQHRVRLLPLGDE